MRLGAIPTPRQRLETTPPLPWRHFAAVPPPATLDRRDIRYQPRLCDNDTLPVCTAAGLVNAALAVAALDGTSLKIDDDKVLDFFAGVVGCAPTKAAIAATPGAVILDVLQQQVQQGFDTGGQTPLVGLHGTVALTRTALANTAALYGSAYLGVSLHDRDMQGGVWDDGGDPGPLIGGHLLLLWGYQGLRDEDLVSLVTWGRFQPATWRWVRARAIEAHGLYWRQLSPARMSIEDSDALAAALTSSVV